MVFFSVKKQQQHIIDGSHNNHKVSRIFKIYYEVLLMLYLLTFKYAELQLNLTIAQQHSYSISSNIRRTFQNSEYPFSLHSISNVLYFPILNHGRSLNFRLYQFGLLQELQVHVNDHQLQIHLCTLRQVVQRFSCEYICTKVTNNINIGTVNLELRQIRVIFVQMLRSTLTKQGQIQCTYQIASNLNQIIILE
ncbi:Hypothetical_protein [Hexamita inflata]|uniref:Hypothetical_protein n=1 Tax=Hexamita inflata TaxID=28002 RepID=A0AA86N8B1_9EUKA|nr:Hypothetical protein HINF_LOCUS1894 [Hexamita inflata]